MRRALLLSSRALLVLLLLGAVVDVPLPASARPRRRIHLIDRSASVGVGADSALRLKDADALVAFDRGRGGDVSFASFAGNIRFDSTGVQDPSRTELRAALEAVLGRDPTEIVLHSDGRGDPGHAPRLCKARGVPVYVFPLGPMDVRDIRFTRVRAPADAAPGERFPIEATLEATWPVKARVRLDGEMKDVDLAPGAPASVVFPDRSAGEHALAIATPDDIAANDALTIRVLERTSKRRVVAIPGTSLPPLPDVERVSDLAGAHAVVVDGPVPDPAAIARCVREGGGLLLVGSGPFEWGGTPLEEVSPVFALPDHKVAVVFAVDVSGSMEKHFPDVLQAVHDTKNLLGAEGLIPMSFSGDVRWLPNWNALRHESGDTNFVNALNQAKARLTDLAGRQHIVLFTDGVTDEKETPEMRAAAARNLGKIGLTVITVDKELDIGVNVKLKDVDALAAELKRIFAGIRETRRERPGRLDHHDHPVVKGLGPIEPASMNLTTKKAEAVEAATVGRPPAVYPAVAFMKAGHGTSGAIAFAPDASLLSRAIAHVARPTSGPWRLSVEPPLVRARGTSGPPRLKARAGGVEFELLQTRSDLWEGRLPRLPTGTVLVELLQGGMASAVLPCPPEFERTGVDRAALERLAAETGGRVLSSSAELATLPPPAAGGTRSGRPFFLVAALAAVFLELALSTFWKGR